MSPTSFVRYGPWRVIPVRRPGASPAFHPERDVASAPADHNTRGRSLRRRLAPDRRHHLVRAEELFARLGCTGDLLRVRRERSMAPSMRGSRDRGPAVHAVRLRRRCHEPAHGGSRTRCSAWGRTSRWCGRRRCGTSSRRVRSRPRAGGRRGARRGARGARDGGGSLSSRLRDVAQRARSAGRQWR